MSANKLLEIVGEVTRLFAELNMYGYDSLARAAAGAAGNGNGGQAQQPRHVPIELPPPIPPPPSQVSRLISRTMDAFEAFFNGNPELLGLCRQIVKINSGAFSAFSAELSAPILVHKELGI